MHPLIEQNRAEILAIAERRGLRDVREFLPELRLDRESGRRIALDKNFIGL